MANFLPAPKGPQVFYLDNFSINATASQQLHRRRETVHRLYLEPASFRSHIPQEANTLIVKQKKEGWDQEFEDEKIAYQRLSSLQGELIPRFYGAGSFDGLPAIFISDISGPNLHDLAHSTIGVEFQEETLRIDIEKAMKALYDAGAEYWDQKLDNFIFSDGRVMVIDLEQVKFPSKLGPWERHVNLGGVGSLMTNFNDIRAPEGEKSWNRSLPPLPGQFDEDGNLNPDFKMPIMIKRAKGRRYSFEEREGVQETWMEMYERLNKPADTKDPHSSTPQEQGAVLGLPDGQKQEDENPVQAQTTALA